MGKGGKGMKECEDCGEECRRRYRCPYCGLLICGWCQNHVHGRPILDFDVERRTRE